MNNGLNKKTFTSAHKQALHALHSLSAVTNDAANVMIRVNTMNIPLAEDADIPGREFFDDDIDTFVITTSADPENFIHYTSPTNVIDMSVNDGGYF
jgi:hypothetical protein